LRLKARFQNGKILVRVFAAIAKIVDYKPIDGSSRQLRALDDTIKNSMSTFKNLEICTKSWDPIIGFFVRRKLDQYMLAALEDSANSPTEVPLMESVLAVLERRSGMLETLDAHPMGHTKPLVSRDNNFKILTKGSHRPLSCNMFRSTVILADPEFGQPGSIDLLLKAEVYSRLIRPGLIDLGNDKPTLQETSLGGLCSA